MSEPEKIFLNARDLLLDAFELGTRIAESGFKPNFIVGIWRGGTPVGIAVQELLDYAGIATDHIAIRTASYRAIGERQKEVRVFGLGYIIRNINHDDSLLIVDDVFDTGLSVDAVIRELENRSRRNMPHDVRIATPWFKPAQNRTKRVPNYYVHETDKWLVFPHELHGLSTQEIADGKPELLPFLHRLGVPDPGSSA